MCDGFGFAFFGCIKDLDQKVLSVGTFKGCFGILSGCSGTFDEWIELHPVESVWPPS